MDSPIDSKLPLNQKRRLPSLRIISQKLYVYQRNQRCRSVVIFSTIPLYSTASPDDRRHITSVGPDVFASLATSISNFIDPFLPLHEQTKSFPPLDSTTILFFFRLAANFLDT
jgi:hypothetical protein